MPIRLLTSGGGTTTIQPTTSASSVTLTVPSVNANVVTTGDTASVTQAMLGSGLAGTGPAFSAYIGNAQNSSHNAYVKAAFNTELYDTANCYDPTTNYRFTPNVAGYYQINIGVDFAVNTARRYYLQVSLYKNGSAFKYSTLSLAAAPGAQDNVRLNSIVYMNGSSDYLETYVYHYDYDGLTTVPLTVGAYASEFSGFLARAA